MRDRRIKISVPFKMMIEGIKMGFNKECSECIYRKAMLSMPENAAEDKKESFKTGVELILENCSEEIGAPVAAWEIDVLYKDVFGELKDFSAIKRKYNDLMLKMEGDIRKEIYSSEEPLKRALQYSMVGNYIDFIALENVSEDKLSELIDQVDGFHIDSDALEDLYRDLEKGGKLLYLTDNCGEIVFDKLLIEYISERYPDADITVMVRGLPISNDSTMEDAVQVGLTDMVRVVGNGTAIGGTPPDHLSPEALKYLYDADIILSKGMGNYETLCYKEISAYYIFLCKCHHFMELFHKPQFTGIFYHKK